MIWTILIVINGLRKFKTLDAWRLAFFAVAWLNVIGGLGHTLFYAGGTLGQPELDGVATAYIRQATNDGPIVALIGILVMAAVYLPMFWFWKKANTTT